MTGSRNGRGGGPGQPPLCLRRVDEGDCRLLWEWANDPVVRALSFESGPIPWDEHARWFRRVMGDPSEVLYLVEDGEGRPIGVVRFSGEGGGSAVVSLTIGGGSRGRGYGMRALEMGVGEFMRTTGAVIVRALIKKENNRSLRTFRSAGFTCRGLMEIKGGPVYEMVFSPEGEGPGEDGAP